MSTPTTVDREGGDPVPLFADGDRAGRIVARVPTRLEVALAEAARLHGRTLSGEVRVALGSWLEDTDGRV
jgi:hypothetical protein